MRSTEITTPRVRVIVTELASGGVVVFTARRSPDAPIGDPDPVCWIDDASIHVPHQPERATYVEIAPHTFITATPPLAF